MSRKTLNLVTDSVWFVL